MDDPTEEIHKKLHEDAEKTGDKSIMKIALSSALIAVLAATASLFSEHQNNEAMLDQLRASDNWSYYQAKGIKSSVLESRIETFKAFGKTYNPAWDEKIAAYKNEQEEISRQATEQQAASARHLNAHNKLSYAVTILQIAIGLSAIAALTRRRWLWLGSIGISVAGLGFLVWGLGLIALIK